MEIDSWIADVNGITYMVNDYAISEEGAKQLINSKQVHYPWEQINGLNAYLESEHDFSNLNKRDAEFLKQKWLCC